MAGYVPGLNSQPALIQDTNDLAAFLKSDGHEENQQKQHLTSVSSEETAAATASVSTLPFQSPSLSAQVPPVLNPDDVICLIRMAICESVVEKVQETYQFEISGTGGGTYYLDLKHG